MLTNVFTPQIGGITRSVQQFSEQFQELGHRVLIIAPEYETDVDDPPEVMRIAAIPKFYQNLYPLPLPVVSALLPRLREFQPEIVHCHHPFLLGTTGQTIAANLGIPTVYTHHTRYSVYMETKTNWPRPIEQGVLDLITGYCDLVDGIIAPSEGIKQILRDRGIGGRIEVIPTGVDVDRFSHGRGDRIREKLGLSREAFVIGHVGRLAKEKNCGFLAKAVGAFLKQNHDAVFLIVGTGAEQKTFRKEFEDAGVLSRVHFLGFREGQDLIDAYHAMDLFAFASHSETQGMVLGEAMAAGVPVLAVSGTGVDDIVTDGANGRVVPHDNVDQYVAALTDLKQSAMGMKDQARRTADGISIIACARHMVRFYQELIDTHPQERTTEWERLRETWETGWEIWKTHMHALATATIGTLGIEEESPSEDGTSRT
ncbi:MAG: glycosyltransferase [Planctomycetaceae bacterium]|nr:glycosyltransferase [Planctomycetaceae bacterium]